MIDCRLFCLSAYEPATTELQMNIMSRSYDVITLTGICRLAVSALLSGQLSSASLTSTVQLKSAASYLDDNIMMR